MVERALLERKREFERRDDLRAAWMTSKAIDIFENQSRAGQNAGNRRCNMPLRERRDSSVKYDAKALRIDLPAHDVERVRPGVLTAHLNGRSRRHRRPEARKPPRHRRTAPWRRYSPWSIHRAGRPGCKLRPRRATQCCRDASRRDGTQWRSPETPPAQPSPKTGTRSTSARNPKRPATLASRLGVAIPVDEIVTIVSTSAASSSAASRARFAASTKSSHAPSR